MWWERGAPDRSQIDLLPQAPYLGIEDERPDVLADVEHQGVRRAVRRPLVDVGRLHGAVAWWLWWCCSVIAISAAAYSSGLLLYAGVVGGLEIATVRVGQVREAGLVRAGARRDALVDHRHGLVRRVGLVDQGNGGSGDRHQLNGDHVVGRPPAVGEPGQVVAEQAQVAGPGLRPIAGGRGDPHVQAQHLRDDLAALVGPDTEGRPYDAAGYPGRKDGHQVGAGLGVGRQVGKGARVEDGKQVLQFGVLDRRGELASLTGGWLLK